MTTDTLTTTAARLSFRTGNRFAEAIAVQDACNPIAVAGLLRDAMRDAQDDKNYSGTDYVKRDPAVCMIIHKLSDLSGLGDSLAVVGPNSYLELYTACNLLAKNPEADRTLMKWFQRC